MSSDSPETSDQRTGTAGPASAVPAVGPAPRRGFRPATLPLLVMLVGGAALAAWMTVRAVMEARTGYLLDLGVFRDAGEAYLHGWDLYGDGFPSRSGFAFIYPPFAALLFVPLTWLSEPGMQTAWTLATVAAVWAIMAMAARRLGMRWAPLVALGLLGPALALEPMRSHMAFGQINIYLFLLVAADLLRFMPGRLRGIGVGIAAGIKITPAAYAVVFLVRKTGPAWRARWGRSWPRRRWASRSSPRSRWCSGRRSSSPRTARAPRTTR